MSNQETDNEKEHILEVPLSKELYRAISFAFEATGILPDVLARIAITRLLQELKKNEEMIVPSIGKVLFKTEDGYEVTI